MKKTYTLHHDGSWYRVDDRIDDGSYIVLCAGTVKVSFPHINRRHIKLTIATDPFPNSVEAQIDQRGYVYLAPQFDTPHSLVERTIKALVCDFGLKNTAWDCGYNPTLPRTSLHVRLVNLHTKRHETAPTQPA